MCRSFLKLTHLFCTLSLLLLFLCGNAFSQIKLDDINLEQIRQKKVRSFINHQQEINIHSIDDIQPTLTEQIIGSEYYRQEKKYAVNEHLNKVWDVYVQTSPQEAWEGKRVSFGVLISRNMNQIMYAGDKGREIDTGQVVYLNLKLLRGIYNLALAFEIINIDLENRVVEFSYIEGNKSEGKQRLAFVEKPNGTTEIIHTSFFRSGSRIRDKYLYPFFHVRATNEFHRNMQKVVNLELQALK